MTDPNAAIPLSSFAAILKVNRLKDEADLQYVYSLLQQVCDIINIQFYECCSTVGRIYNNMISLSLNIPCKFKILLCK
jgi:hypothetical protein